VTGDKKWEVTFDEPPLASVLATAGNLACSYLTRAVCGCNCIATMRKNGQDTVVAL